jgi:hypothetical protein
MLFDVHTSLHQTAMFINIEDAISDDTGTRIMHGAMAALQLHASIICAQRQSYVPFSVCC